MRPGSSPLGHPPLHQRPLRYLIFFSLFSSLSPLSLSLSLSSVGGELEALGGGGGNGGDGVRGSVPRRGWEYVFSFVTEDVDRNSISLVCRAWHRLDRLSRASIFVGNCYAVDPRRAIERFPGLRWVSLKGKPHFADFNLGCPLLEGLRMKRMVVTDECLELIARSFRNFRALDLNTCEGFSTAGLAAIAANCRHLRELNLQENNVEDWSGHWLSHFPESSTSLVSLSIACLEGPVNLSVLERLLSRNPNLQTLRLNQAVPLERLASILHLAPDSLTSVQAGSWWTPMPISSRGIGTGSPLPHRHTLHLRRLTSLNLSYATLQSADLIKLVSHSTHLQQLWVMDLIEDDGLEAVASSCKQLEDLRVFPSDPYGQAPPVALTERGLVAVSAGCPRLQSVLYFCRQMTNAALAAIACNRPNLVRFRLCIMEPRVPDYVTLQPLDAGFGAVVAACHGLRRLSVSGLLTDKFFEAIDGAAQQLEMLSVAFAGESDAGLHHVLSGCPRLRKLEIRDCPFGDKALLDNAAKLETMRSLWMSSCSVTLGACRALARKMPQLSVEVIEETRPGSPDSWPDDTIVEKLYIYRTLAGPRRDAPDFVWIL
ncbi:unnamed protein product [Spirodela intermedia]|uniref:COI1 F-box domain-containing protein n=1 Tax=Spirodela intermedia TaxID=51605 RepID=A0A7I8IVQ6_SPIIN|nr:unnamed protein product [Spirodela intermedia]CAA6662077.1 unnamed protein product [Spirodela intermedia]